VLVSHANHARELSEESQAAFTLLASNGVTLFNQSVVLAGVNDSSDTLIALSKALFAQGVLPYYLHLPDAVAGTAHFDVPIIRAKALVAEMQAQLPGYLIPRLVREEPGNDSKTRYA
jgi:L-lysine 2,3-aminomutase